MKKNLRMAVTAALTLGVVSLGGVQAFAADEDRTADEHMLGETVVTATRTPNKELKANANITVITGKDAGAARCAGRYGQPVWTGGL